MTDALLLALRQTAGVGIGGARKPSEEYFAEIRTISRRLARGMKETGYAGASEPSINRINGNHRSIRDGMEAGPKTPVRPYHSGDASMTIDREFATHGHVVRLAVQCRTNGW